LRFPLRRGGPGKPARAVKGIRSKQQGGSSEGIVSAPSPGEARAFLSFQSDLFRHGTKGNDRILDE
jgi:hypothetical protein